MGGNGGLGALNYHHGITTIYQGNDGTNTGTYVAQSQTGGQVTNLVPLQLGGATPTASPAPVPSTAVSIKIENTIVDTGVVLDTV